jgi:hypothetical protein
MGEVKLDVIAAQLGLTVGNVFSRLFELREIAEVAVNAAIKKARDAPGAGNTIDAHKKVARIEQALVHACPPEGMSALADAVYKAHVDELIGRAVGAEALVPATKAEVLTALHYTSLKSPLQRNAQVLYERLFLEIVPKARTHPELMQVLAPSWARAADDLLVEFRRKLRKPERK